MVDNISSEAFVAVMLGLFLSRSCRSYIGYVLTYEDGPFNLLALYRHVVRRLELSFEPERYIAMVIVAALLLGAVLADNSIPALVVAAFAYSWESNKEYI